MKLNKRQFDILVALCESETAITQRKLEEQTGYSLGTINRTVKELAAAGYVLNGKITGEGIEALQPYRVKRAIFLAAGLGSRMIPLTFNTPKPLIRVHGVRIIDRLIDICLNTGIEEIYIVRGYLSEQFDQLQYKYPMVRFLENPLYNEANNIGSALVARYLLSNAYVFEADLLINNPKIIRKYHYQSNYLGIKKSRTDDWCARVKDGLIEEEMVGGEGEDIWRLMGVSYWNEADGHKLSQDIPEVYASPGGKERYWEQVPLVYRKGNYQVEIRECLETDIAEIDTYRELKEIDKTYDI